jgi:transcriptional regulator with XRE-family HTH domain
MKKPRKKTVHPYILSVGAEIKKIRLQRKLSLDHLGSEIGLDASNVRKLEIGQNLTLNTLLKLCICLEITPAKLFDKISWDLTAEDLEVLTTVRSVKKNSKRLKK